MGDLLQFVPKPKGPKVVWEGKSSMTEWRIVFRPFDSLYELQKKWMDNTWTSVTSGRAKEDLIKQWVKLI